MSTRFVIVGAARTGSTLMVKTLDSVDGIRCHGELLNNQAVRGYADDFDPYAATPEERKARADRLAAARSADAAGFVREALSSAHSATGFKALYSALFDARWAPVVDYLRSDADLRFIHLVRHNALRRYVSERILMEGGTNHSAVGGRSNRSVMVNIDIDAFRARTAQIDAEVARARELLAGRKVLEVSYEDMAANTGGTIAAIAAFLGVSVDPADIEPALEKVGSSDLRDSVSNYEELLGHEATRELALHS